MPFMNIQEKHFSQKYARTPASQISCVFTRTIQEQLFNAISIKQTNFHLQNNFHQQMRLLLFIREAMMRAPTICPNTALLTVNGTSHIPKPKNRRIKKIKGIDICTAKNHDFENLRHLARHCPNGTFIRNAVVNTIKTSSKLQFTSSTKNIIHTY